MLYSVSKHAFTDASDVSNQPSETLMTLNTNRSAATDLFLLRFCTAGFAQLSVLETHTHTLVTFQWWKSRTFQPGFLLSAYMKLISQAALCSFFHSKLFLTDSHSVYIQKTFSVLSFALWFFQFFSLLLLSKANLFPI